MENVIKRPINTHYYLDNMLVKLKFFGVSYLYISYKGSLCL